MERKDMRIQLVISQSEIDALDEWRAKHKIWSRSEAIRQLIARGVDHDEFVRQVLSGVSTPAEVRKAVEQALRRRPL